MSPSPKSYLVGQWGTGRGNQRAWFLQASADISGDAMPAKPKLATLFKQITLETTGQSKTSRTLVEIEYFLHQNNQEVMLFNKMSSVFTVSFWPLRMSLCTWFAGAWDSRMDVMAKYLCYCICQYLCIWAKRYDSYGQGNGAWEINGCHSPLHWV